MSDNCFLLFMACIFMFLGIFVFFYWILDTVTLHYWIPGFYCLPLKSVWLCFSKIMHLRISFYFYILEAILYNLLDQSREVLTESWLNTLLGCVPSAVSAEYPGWSVRILHLTWSKLPWYPAIWYLGIVQVITSWWFFFTESHGISSYVCLA